MDVSVMAQEGGRSPHNGQQALFPRALTPFERATLLWLLPEDKPGYNEYRKYISMWKVVGEGRRGSGNYILAEPSTIADAESPLPQVLAYGMIEADRADISVTLRELLENQLEFEIVNVKGETIPEHFTEKRRWNFSLWTPKQPCPICCRPPREVTIRREIGSDATLAVCVSDRRLWICDARDGVNHLIPVTNFHNALMLYKNIRDPERALAADNFFKDLHMFSDPDLTAAFVHYNKLRKKVDLGTVLFPKTKITLLERVASLFRK
jgi:hypothetical protein